MDIISFFKRKTKEEEEFIKSMNDFNLKLDQSKFLKMGDLRIIPDDDLRAVVMGWMWGKVEEDWSMEAETLKSLPKPCRDVYSCITAIDEVLNGGLNQLFFNSSVGIAEMAAEGFCSIGLDVIGEAMKTAIVVYEENRELIEEYDDNTIEGFSESYELKLFDDLDDIFCGSESLFDSRLLDYIRNHEADFGD